MFQAWTKWCSLLCLVLGAFSIAGSTKIEKEVYDAFSHDFSAMQTYGDTEEKGVRVIVHLDPSGKPTPELLEHEDDLALASLADEVYTTQSLFLEELQTAGLMERPDDDGPSVFQVELLLTYQYAFAATVADADVLEEIAAFDEVQKITIDRLNELFTVQGRNITGSTRAANAGFRGNGIGVAVIDTQFDLLHPELGGSTRLPNSVVAGGRNFSDSSPIHSRDMSRCYHGTGTASIVHRYAPNADIYALVVFPNAYDSVIANAIDWCVSNRNGVNGGARIRVISMSLGGGRYTGTCNSGVIHTSAGVALRNGIVVLAASGNNGWTNAIASPACSSNVISIGATWDANNARYTPFPPANCNDSSRRVNERTCYSNTSAALDLYAPSEEVICARCGGGTAPLGGTSSACPAAAGMLAQYFNTDRSLFGNRTGIINRFRSTGVVVAGDSGKRRMDLMAAIGNCVDAPSGIAAWWPFDESSGSTARDIAGSSHGNRRGASFSSGRVGRAYKFDGSNDYVSVPNRSAINLGTGDFTITAWIRTTQNHAIILTKRNSADNRGYLFMVYGKRLLLQMADNPRGHYNYTSTSIPIVANNAWRHVAVTVDRNNTRGGRMYVDGNLVYTFNPTNRQGSLNTSDALRIGQRDGAGSYFKGNLDEVTLYKRALSATQIRNEFLAGADGKCR
ncbi:S8 family serine peptidase [Sulfidibacter corallicola]|uniref:S8 family serine peptidase n=1 Tax=Sulfidibacter corallicola TaxID=2818388 RepID=A0A8A4TNH2_SULCO|nr:LamG-like jellyroll fold domain-containing protein [Sulfidibacter corallicola]QTD50652.1 S8 family serine peptidase [Sulfidibacter corallicola]